MTKETLDTLENELTKTRNCTFKSETIKQLIALARAGLEADDLKEQVAFLQTDLGAMERVSNNLKQELVTLKQSLAPMREVLAEHHKHHQEKCLVFFSQGGRPIDIETDLGEAYSESALAEKTSESIALLDRLAEKKEADTCKHGVHVENPCVGCDEDKEAG